jgi:hypothetical protein
VDRVAQNESKVQCEILTDSGQTLEERIRNREREPSDGTVRVIDRHWSDFRRQR